MKTPMYEAVARAVLIGTDEYWAPPRGMYFDLGSDFIIRNVTAAKWPIYEDGLITRCAVYARASTWLKTFIRPTRVQADTDCRIEVGAIRIPVNGEVYDDIPRLAEMIKSALRRGVHLDVGPLDLLGHGS